MRSVFFFYGKRILKFHLGMQSSLKFPFSYVHVSHLHRAAELQTLTETKLLNPFGVFRIHSWFYYSVLRETPALAK